MGGLKFGIDSSGNYGYIKAGADSVTPFNNSGALCIDYTYLSTTDSHTLSKQEIGNLSSGEYLLLIIAKSYGCFNVSHLDVEIGDFSVNKDNVTNGTKLLFSSGNEAIGAVTFSLDNESPVFVSGYQHYRNYTIQLLIYKVG